MSEKTKTDEIIVKMINDFLRWPLPKSVRADGCALIQQEGRTGTNIFSAAEATAMMQEVIRPHLERIFEGADARDASRFRWLLNQGIQWRGCYKDGWQEGEWLYSNAPDAIQRIDAAISEGGCR